MTDFSFWFLFLVLQMSTNRIIGCTTVQSRTTFFYFKKKNPKLFSQKSAQTAILPKQKARAWTHPDPSRKKRNDTFSQSLRVTKSRTWPCRTATTTGTQFTDSEKSRSPLIIFFFFFKNISGTTCDLVDPLFPLKTVSEIYFSLFQKLTFQPTSTPFRPKCLLPVRHLNC